jgi:parvulin-like peptidyl-prolyl isomerase
MRGTWLLLLAGCRVASQTSPSPIDAAPVASASATVAAAGGNLVLLPEAGLPEGRIRARHIVISTAKHDKADARKRIDELAKKLADGADFAALASEHCEDATRVRGGDLGVFSRSDMIAPIADAAFALKVSEISPVIETDQGFHLIQRTQ